MRGDGSNRVLVKRENLFSLFSRLSRILYISYNRKIIRKQKGESNVFKKRFIKVRETTLDKMRFEAMNAEDYSTVKKLNDIEAEQTNRLLRERLKGIFGGYGSAMAGFTVGIIILNKVKSKD